MRLLSVTQRREEKKTTDSNPCLSMYNILLNWSAGCLLDRSFACRLGMCSANCKRCDTLQSAQSIECAHILFRHAHWHWRSEPNKTKSTNFNPFSFKTHICIDRFVTGLPRQANFAHGYRLRADVCAPFRIRLCAGWSWFFCPWFESKHVPYNLARSHEPKHESFGWTATRPYNNKPTIILYAD